MKWIHDIAGGVAGLGACSLAVGIIDRISSRADIGPYLLYGGAIVCLVGIVGVLLQSRTYGLKSAVIVGAGLVPFAAFGFFLVWRIGLSSQQASACSNGDAVACRTLGQRRFERQKLEDARRLLARGCTLGDAESCLTLASMNAKNSALSKRVHLLDRGCDLGSGLACYRLYLMTTEGVEMSALKHSASHYLSQACSLAYTPACIDVQAQK